MNYIFTLAFSLLCFQIQAQNWMPGPFQNLSLGTFTVADFNEDGNDDVFGIQFHFLGDNELVLMTNDATNPISFSRQELNLDFDAFGRPAAGDIDNDGDMDIIIAKNGEGVFMLQNDGEANFTPVNLEIMGATTFLVHDLEGDNDLDIIGINIEENTLDVFVNNGNTEFTKNNLLTTNNDIQYFDVADMNDDGYMDIVLGFDEFSGDQIILFSNNGSNIFSETSIVSNDFSKLQQLKIADMNNDGLLDIVAIQNFASDAWINQGSETYTRQNLLGYEGTPGLYRSLIIGDYNGDGRADIITGDNNDDIAWHKNISTNPLSYERAIVGSVAPAFSFANGDFDNDGDTDIIVSNGEFWWYENQIEQEPNSVLDFMEKRITVFPNPFQGEINIDVSNYENYRIKLHFITGALLFSQKLDSQNIDLSFLSKGVYIFSLENSSTQEIHSIQLVKIK